MKKELTFLIFSLFIFQVISADGQKLTGTPISSEGDSASQSNAFSDDLTSKFTSSKESNGWVGLKFEKSYRITKIGWAEPENNSTSYLLGVFEGANQENFEDAVPLTMIKEEGKIGQMNYVDIEVSRSFKYVRYMGPSKTFSVISGFEVYGTESNSNSDEDSMYQVTNIPMIVIHTEDGKDPVDRDNYIPCIVTIVDGKKVNVKKGGKIKLKGNSTLNLKKKSYKIKFEEKTGLLDMKAVDKEWGLLANHQDRTLMRNLVAFKISSLLKMAYTPVCKPVDVMVNGEFKGNYHICDAIEVGKNRIEITEMDQNSNEEPEITGGYLVEVDGGGLYGSSHYRTTKGINYNINYPDEDDLTSQQQKYIKDFFNSVENEVYNDIVDSIDIESFSKFFLIQEFCGNIDAVWSSYFMTKERGEHKFRFGPVWDFDLGLDNDHRLYPTNSRDNFVFKYGTSSGTMRKFVINLLSNANLLQAIKSTWKEITSTVLKKETLLNFIDETLMTIDESSKLNFKRWKIMEQRVFLDKMPSGSFDGEIKILRDYVSERFDVLSEIIEKTTTENAGQGVQELRYDPYYDPDSDNPYPWGGGGWGGGGFPGWGGDNGTFPWGGGGGGWGGWGDDGGNDNPWGQGGWGGQGGFPGQNTNQ